MTDAPLHDELKNLVIFIVVLAIVATILALAWYFIVELPVEQAAALQVPTNRDMASIQECFRTQCIRPPMSDADCSARCG